ncbi:MAG: 50S ribosomal protein L6 [Opitutales bacterium]|nr:50S ribosomal protein L6 [Opitutales bacterium]MCH8539881.1 50S ribosomal protein L6 [Opitutales bacterium]
MSRIGKLPVAVPGNVKVTIDGNTVAVEGPKGKLSETFKEVKVSLDDNNVTVEPLSNSRFSRSMYGTARSIIANMVQGVSEGFVKNVEIQGVGFRAALNGRNLNMNLGYSHPIDYEIPEGVTVTLDGNTKIKIESHSKQKVGAVAAALKRFYPPEPYKGKGVHIIGEFVRRKEGKTVS